jgi:hypothetical protein
LPDLSFPENLGIILSSDHKLFQETNNQLQKDFLKVGWAERISLSQITDFETLQNTIAPLLGNHFDSDNERFFRLIYIIDLPESVVKNLLSQTDCFEKLARMIIFREATKVLLRRSYS